MTVLTISEGQGFTYTAVELVHSEEYTNKELAAIYNEVIEELPANSRTLNSVVEELITEYDFDYFGSDFEINLRGKPFQAIPVDDVDEDDSVYTEPSKGKL